MPRPITKTQVAARIPIITLEAMREEARTRGVSVSEILRSTYGLRHKISTLPGHLRAAIVDTSRRNRVVEFIGIKE